MVKKNMIDMFIRYTEYDEFYLYNIQTLILL